ncbi:DUF2130 domain-containing protein [Rhodoferax sp.]|uniref:DUF2130 domain-containing protein n=1 Tax=Rhodoferax sp. TaxID=50421 RepID=UPI0027361777|nr:DUF2130 domain-containing protein [Rhodoferax sp.]MDP3190647.1 DUF2130 domain-containing protein [Rhodoferax sp.]
MQKKIIIASDEVIVCPECNHQFSLDQGITRHTIERYEHDFSDALAIQTKNLEATLAKEAERKASKLFTAQLAKLQEDLADLRKAEKAARAQVASAQLEAKTRAKAEFALEKAALAEELADKNKLVQSFREQELALRKQQKQLEEQQANMQVELERKLDEERKRLTTQIGTREAERFSLIEAEYKKKIDDAQKANEDLRRKLDQGSQQLQGEVLELELEHMLANAFFHDLIEEVKKGQRGADVVQTVRTPMGQICGKIIWETKRAENWSDKWLQKLKDDQQTANADLAVIVTTVMPKGITDSFCRIGDVWVVSPEVMRPVAETLRVILLEAQRLKLVNTGRNEKMEQLYNYLSSAQFAQRVRTMLEGFVAMRSDLDSEKRAMQKIWAKRQTQIERVTGRMVSVVGELQAIAQDQLPQLDSMMELDAIGMDDNSNDA